MSPNAPPAARTHGGRRAGAGRKPYLTPAQRRVRRSFLLAPDLDAQIMAARAPGETHTQTVERLLRAGLTVPPPAPKPRGRRSQWKEYRFARNEDLRRLDAAWQSSRDALGRHKRFVVMPRGERDVILTNLSQRGMQALARHAQVRLPDFLTGWDPDAPAPWDDDPEP